MKLHMIKMTPERAERPDLTKSIPYATYQQHISRYIFTSRFVENKVVLDIACRPSTGSKFLVETGPKQVARGRQIQGNTKEGRVHKRRIDAVEFILADAQASPFHSDYNEKYIPSLLTQDSPVHKIVTAMARQQDA